MKRTTSFDNFNSLENTTKRPSQKFNEIRKKEVIVTTDSTIAQGKGWSIFEVFENFPVSKSKYILVSALSYKSFKPQNLFYNLIELDRKIWNFIIKINFHLKLASSAQDLSLGSALARCLFCGKMAVQTSSSGEKISDPIRSGPVPGQKSIAIQVQPQVKSCGPQTIRHCYSKATQMYSYRHDQSIQVILLYFTIKLSKINLSSFISYVFHFIKVERLETWFDPNPVGRSYKTSIFIKPEIFQVNFQPEPTLTIPQDRGQYLEQPVISTSLRSPNRTESDQENHSRQKSFQEYRRDRPRQKHPSRSSSRSRCSSRNSNYEYDVDPANDELSDCVKDLVREVKGLKILNKQTKNLIFRTGSEVTWPFTDARFGSPWPNSRKFSEVTAATSGSNHASDNLRSSYTSAVYSTYGNLYIKMI